jgi:hypothetical protein
LLAAWVVALARGADAQTETPPPPTAAPGTSAAAPSDPEGALGLLSDLEKIVNAQEHDDWFVDEYAYDEILVALMPSVCRATPAARAQAVAATAARQRTTGDPQQQFARVGELTDEVEAALHAQRQHEALTLALRLVPKQCPFWIHPVPAFAGRQTNRARFALSVETGGLAQLRRADGDVHLGGGGAGRLLASYRFGSAATLLSGLEFGGGAMVRPETSASEFVINYFPALPTVLRLHDVAWHYEIETAAVGLLQADNTRPSYGIRVGAGVGFSTLRLRSLLPWAGFALAGEHFFAGGGRSAQQFFRAGLRVGFFWDPE